ncbi:hypothetical protein [Cellulosilyticum lentocellum]|uniref:Uncharacterized protein n=1 Tax=Cellulosilyticum lentocellum (strain ATCC 49066 / DSM 5427 / NCIMB 11756 / RHM5) TaxID=642492 RepID=F2JHS9_CELLD|nr:hypothetical protein [Cellulosilyticum lentocellum]ADZ85421.1 hypothetical protein Clole_3740 [Cellulosilyticum lentocellum DSM 5427]
MGISGILLKNKDEMNFEKLIRDIKCAAHQANIVCLEGLEFEKNNDGTYEYMTFILAEKEQDGNEFLIYAYNDTDDMIDGMFSFINEKKNYQQCINIESFKSTKILLDFIYEYMKLNKDDIFYDELNWHYTFEEIEYIANMGTYDAQWCYKKPQE